MDNMNEKISIIVYSYNTEKYIEKCINSLINQKYKNLEIILVNDGSTDNSLHICNEYKNLDSRIIVIDKEHTGVADCRNIGIKKATGEYIGFVDSNDFVHEDIFKKLIFSIIKFGCKIAMCYYKDFYDEEQNESILFNYEEYSEFVLGRERLLQELLKGKVIKNYIWLCLFERNLFNGIEFPKGRKFEDISTMYKLFNKTNKIACIPYPLYFYRKRNNSIANTDILEEYKDYLFAIFERYYDLKNSNDDIQSYNVFAIYHALIISINKIANNIEKYEPLDEEFYEYFCKFQRELSLINEDDLIKLMNVFEKKFFYIMKMCVKDTEKIAST